MKLTRKKALDATNELIAMRNLLTEFLKSGANQVTDSVAESPEMLNSLCADCEEILERIKLLAVSNGSKIEFTSHTILRVEEGAIVKAVKPGDQGILVGAREDIANVMIEGRIYRCSVYEFDILGD